MSQETYRVCGIIQCITVLEQDYCQNCSGAGRCLTPNATIDLLSDEQY